MQHAVHVLDAAGALICSIFAYVKFRGLELVFSQKNPNLWAVPQADLRSSDLKDFCGTWRRLRGGQWVQAGFGHLSASKVQVGAKMTYLRTKAILR